MKLLLGLVIWINQKLKALSIRLVKWTGKSKEYIHPKHLIEGVDQQWYVSDLNSSDIVLDLGCGSGMHAIYSAKKVVKVKGIDYSERNLEIAKKLAESHRLTNITFEKASLEEKLLEPDSAYSVALALDILEHLHHRELFLSEVYRVLRPGGKLFLAVPNIDTSWKQLLKKNGLFFYSDPDHKYEYSKEEIVNDLKSHRFRISKIDNTVYDTPWIGVIDLIGGISIGWYRALSEWRRDSVRRAESETTGYRIIAEKVL